MAWDCSLIRIGFTIDGYGNLWVSDVNDEATVLGMSAKNVEGVIRGQEVLKLSPSGKVLMTLGKEGVSGNGPDTFDRPTGVAIAPNGDIFVTDGHLPNAHNTGRVVKFSRDGRFIKTWGHLGAAPGDFDEPHDIFIGGSQGRVYVADRKNSRIQVFDQDGNFIAAWKQFGEPSSVFVGKDDTIYVGAAFPDPSARKGQLRGIVVGGAKRRPHSRRSFPDPADPDKLDVGTTASGIAADDAGSIYAADVAAHNLRKYVKVRVARRTRAHARLARATSRPAARHDGARRSHLLVSILHDAKTRFLVAPQSGADLPGSGEGPGIRHGAS